MPGPMDYLMNLRYGKKGADGTRIKPAAGKGKDIELPNESGRVDPRLGQHRSAMSEDAFKQAEAMMKRNKMMAGSK